MGSKSRIAKHIVPIIQSKINSNKYRNYIEPFAGGMNVIDKVICERRFACDLNKYLIALFQHLQGGGSLPETVDRELYSKVRSAPHEYEDWFVGCIGFLASYNGRWFDGGYAQPGIEKTKTGERYRDYYREAKANILAQIPSLMDVRFMVRDYIAMEPHDSVIYCDPPYMGTKQYQNARQFDHERFWKIMRAWSNNGNNIVLISEETAPSDFICLWEQEVSRSIKATDKRLATEKLFIYDAK